MRRLLIAVALLLLTTRSFAAEPSARQSLGSTLPEVKFDNVSLSDAIDFVHDITNVNIHVDWKSLEAAGIGKDTTVNIRLRGVPMRKVLTTILSEAGSGNLLTYYIDQNVIEITTREIADKQLITKIYPVDDLIADVPDFDQPPNFQLQASTVGGGGGGQNLFNSTQNNTTTANTRAARAQQLIDTIQAIIQPEVWNTNGGPAAIRFYNGSLVVTAPRSVHEALGGSVD
jgi:type II secretory pathway component GspD/PulD (secretin)